MGILNATPDSFSDGGKNLEPREAFQTAESMIDAGASVLDVGGESTRPGAAPVTVKEELERVIPVIKAVGELGVQVSIDSYKPEVIKAGLDAGATWINDVTGLRDDEVVGLAVEYGVKVCIMHMQGNPQSMQNNPSYNDVVGEVRDFLKSRAEKAVDAGVSGCDVVVDPGIGFGKSLKHNLELLRDIKSIQDLGYPVLVGHSRKRFIGDILGLPVEERVNATSAVTAYLAGEDVDYVRVHDVEENMQAIRMMESIMESRNSMVN